RVLAEEANRRRDRENLAFAANLAAVSEVDLLLVPAIPIENVLERVFAPWAKEKALLLVMDGFLGLALPPLAAFWQSCFELHLATVTPIRSKRLWKRFGRTHR